MGRVQREIANRLVGRDSESRHVLLQLHATGTVVSGDYLLISFRRPTQQMDNHTPILIAGRVRTRVSLSTYIHVAVNSSAWKTGNDAIHLQAAVLADRCTMHHVSVTHTNVSRQTAVKPPSHYKYCMYLVGVAVDACHLRQHQMSPSLSSTHLSSELITVANSFHSDFRAVSSSNSERNSTCTKAYSVAQAECQWYQREKLS